MLKNTCNLFKIIHNAPIQTKHEAFKGIVAKLKA